MMTCMLSVPLNVPPAITEGSFGWNAMHIKQLCQNKRDDQNFYNFFSIFSLSVFLYHTYEALIFEHLLRQNFTYFYLSNKVARTMARS